MSDRSEIKALLLKEFSLEMRSKHFALSTMLYVFSTVFICYLSFRKFQGSPVLMWLILLFAIINASNRAFFYESGSQRIYLYTLARARNVIIAKLVYHWIANSLLSLLTLLAWSILFGLDGDMAIGFLCLMLPAVWAMSNVITLGASLAAGTRNSSAVLAVITLPVVLPVLMAATHTGGILSFAEGGGALSALLVLSALNVLTAALSIILFEYLWRY